MAKRLTIKISVMNEKLQRIYDRADIAEAFSPGSSLSLLPTEKDLRRLISLATKLAKLRRRACQLGIRKWKRTGKIPIKYLHNFQTMALNARKINGSFKPKSFAELAAMPRVHKD